MISVIANLALCLKHISIPNKNLKNLEIELPALIIACPVGFVSAEESKEELIKFNSAKVPYITVRGKKGGSAVAVAIIHGLIKLASV
ncbi:MAG: precorrin-8X methylmutase [Oligoflexia bacterium]|nr:precorrin-8X methylmutase [Oligoflexia bacterium]